MMNKFFYNKSGYTFMEIMVVVSLIVIVLSLSTVNYRSAGQRTEAAMLARQLVSDLRLMESYAVSAKEFNETAGQNIWGVYLKEGESNYILFVDINGNGQYDESNGELYRQVVLPKNIEIESGGEGISLIKNDGDAPVSKGQVSISFTPPDPQTEIAYSADDKGYSKATITLLNESNGFRKSLTVNFFGTVALLPE